MIRSSGSRIAAWSAGAVLLAMLVPGIALAQPVKSVGFPIDVVATVNGDSVSIIVDIERTPKQIVSCTYWIDGGPATDCGTAGAVGRKAARYSIALTSQPVGDHTVDVKIWTAREPGSGRALFTILAPG